MNLLFFSFENILIIDIFEQHKKPTLHLLQYSKIRHWYCSWIVEHFLICICGAFVVTSNQNHWIIHLFNIIQILNKYKIFQDHRIRKFSDNIDLRKLDFLSPEKISERTRFVNKDIMHFTYLLTYLVYTGMPLKFFH